MFFIFFLIAFISNLPFYQLYSQEEILAAPDVNVISVSPVQGSGLDIERVPGKVQILNRESLIKRRTFQSLKHLIEKQVESLFLI